MRGAWLAACAGLLAACGNEPPALPKPPVTDDLQVRVRRRPALAPLRDAPGLSSLGAPAEGAGDGKLHLHVLDVGHGDAALVVSPTGRTVLVDTGTPESATFLANRLAEQVQKPLDILALTHARPEHAGGLEGVLRAVSADRVVLPAQEADGAEALLASARARGVPVYAPGASAGRPFSVELGGGAALELYGPLGPSSGAGLVLRVTYGATAVLFPGDASAEVEAELVREGAALRSTVLKVGAHGLASATGERWLAAVQPSAAILSFGPGNLDGAPSQEVMDRLRAAKVATWRTDLDGELHLESDGEQLLLSVERPAAGEPAGGRHRYVQGQLPSRLAPAGTPLPRVAPAQAAAVAARPASPPPAAAAAASRDELELPGNWAKPPGAAQAPPAPAARPPPAPTRAAPPAGDDLALPANWAKPTAGAATAGARPAAGAPAAPAPKPPAPRAAPAEDDLAIPGNWGKPAPTSAPAPTAPAQKSPPAAPRQAGSTAGGYAASKASKKFHTTSCDAVGKIKAENLVTFKTREEAASGREPAKDCNP